MRSGIEEPYSTSRQPPIVDRGVQILGLDFIFIFRIPFEFSRFSPSIFLFVESTKTFPNFGADLKLYYTEVSRQASLHMVFLFFPPAVLPGSSLRQCPLNTGPVAAMTLI